MAESRAIAEDAVAKVDVELRAAAGSRRHGDRAGARRAGDPSRARRQPLLPARQRERQGRRRLRRRAQDRRGHLPHRPAYRRHARAALDPGRLQPRYRQAHRVPLHAGAAHDAGRVRQAPAPARGRRARDLHRRRRQLRHQGARLSRRGGGRRDRQDHGPPRQVHRRPAGELLDRHPRARPPHHRPHGRRRRRAASPLSTSTTSPASAPIRSIRAPARSKATRSSTWSAGPTTFANYRAKTTVVLQNKTPDLPVPRRRPPDRHRRHRRPRRPRRRSAGPRSRSSSAAAT